MAALQLLSPLLLTVTLSPLASATSCPEDPGWWAAGPSCYLMSQGPLSWHTAREVRSGQKGFNYRVSHK